MQTLRKKTSPCKYRNDPGRFFGDGVTFKAKLIGILEVGEARGDKMCQEALQDLKMAIRAAGEHKQRITIHVTIDGLRLRDEKTGDSLYHHPVHKISFIAQDMTDSRAFGYIFGSPDSGHRFFGIKTDKAASQVVLAMRDLFQVVFELKKKEIELARQQIQSKTIHEHQASALPSLLIKSTSSDTSNLANKNDGAKANNTKEPNLMSPESVADLVDLEQELSSIQRGITQLDRITPSEPTGGVLSSIESALEDPFGDSFTNFGSGSGTGSKTYNLLPPPESSRSRHSKPNKPPESVNTTVAASVTGTVSSSSPTPRSYPYSYNTNPKSNSTNTTQESENWLNELENTDVFNESAISNKSVESATSSTGTITQNTNSLIVAAITNDENTSSIQQQQQQSGENVINNNSKSLQLCTESGYSSVIDTHSQYTDAFTELDPLGTGKSKPYVDKKYFFHELKNPPKKVLKDLSGCGLSSLLNDTPGFTFTAKNDSSNDMDDIFDTSESYELPSSGANCRNNGSSLEVQSSLFPIQISNTNHIIHSNFNKPFHIDIDSTVTDPNTVMVTRDTDPFSPTRKKSDPFQDGDIFSKLDPFEFEFAKSKILSDTKVGNDNEKLRKDSITTPPSVFNGPLQVSLPPENTWTANASTAGNTYPDPTYSSQRGRIDRQSSESPTSASRNRPSVFKQNTVDVISSISSKKMPHLFGQKFTKRDSHSINMRRLQESDSLSENEAAPEPPPRPDTWSQHEPPPLPPKKQFSDIVIRPRITSSSVIQPPPTRYDYATAKIKSSQLSLDGSGSAPPIPLPSRRVGRTDSSYPGPGRPRKPGCDDEDYLAPLSGRGDVPPLLPPPQTKSRSSRRQESLDNKPIQNITSVNDKQSITDILVKKSDTESILPDITLSQLLTLGIDDLANKLNVPITKLNTMTIVELTSYLSEFLERSKTPKSGVVSKQTSANIEENTHVFKVNFDQNSDVTFVAKFDDNFGDESLIINAPFVANFSQFDAKPEPIIAAVKESTLKTIVPSADRYAVFREIMDQDIIKSDSIETKSSPENDEDYDDYENNDNSSPLQHKLQEFSDEDEKTVDNPVPQLAKIDNKISEAISHAKDRYAALRDIILVEDLFDNTANETKFVDLSFGDEMQIDDKFMEEFPPVTGVENLETVNEKMKGGHCREEYDSSPDSNHNFDDLLELEPTEITHTNNHKDTEVKRNGGSLFMHTLTVSANNKDDLEIDELMNRAISNLSLDSRDHLSPNNQNKSPIVRDNNQQASPVSPSLLQQQFRKSPLSNPMNRKSQFNDVSTSPIPISIQQSKSPALIAQSLNSPSIVAKSPINKSPIQTRSPIPQSSAVINLIGSSSNKLNNSGSLSDMVCGSSPDLEKQQIAPVASESWAIFDKPNEKKESASVISQQQHTQRTKSSSKGQPQSSSNNKDLIGESPCSSDGKDDWKNPGGNRRWPKGQTSSSSRDLSPWDDETNSVYKKRIPPGTGADRHGYYTRHSKRINSCDDDYEYDDEISKRRDRKSKSGISRSRETFEFDSQNWYQPGTHHSWSPQDEDDRIRSFDRGVYERSSYGPPGYDKREHKLPPHSGYDRRANDYKPGYDKRKYYREYCRPTDYDFESYGESPDIKDRKMMYSRRDYENIYEDGGGFNRSDSSRTGGGVYKAREYFYGSGTGERRSFDRESVESYESTGRRRKSFGSGEVYGSFDSREEFRERYLGGSAVSSSGGGEKTRSLRMGFKMRSGTGGEDYEQDSENDVQIHRSTGEHTRSLQRPASGSRIRKSSGSSPWDGEEPAPVAGCHGPKGWKRPSSASESSERRMTAENRRVLSHTLSGGSDGEKDRRFRKKQRGRGKDGTDPRLPVSNLPPPAVRYSSTHRDNYDYVYDDYTQDGPPPPPPPTSKIDEDKFERLNRRRHDMSQRLVEAERRKRTGNSTSGEKYSYDDEEDDSAISKYTTPIPTAMVTPKEPYIKGEKDRYAGRSKYETYDDPKSQVPQKVTTGSGKSVRNDYDFDDYEETPRSNASSNGGKFNFEEHGFESDFNASPPAIIPSQKLSGCGKSITPKSSFRFSNDFSSDKHGHHQNQAKQSITSTNYNPDFSPTIASIATPAATSVHSITPTTTTPLQKLRFDDKVTISKFDNNEPSSSAFDDDDDDFSKAQFDFENEDQWHPDDPPKKNNMRLGNSTNKQYHQRQQSCVNQQQHDHLRKSESVNIFAKKADDPFEDDDFFNSSNNEGKKNNNNGNNGNGNGKVLDSFHWDNNFAKFDENM